MKRKHKTKMDWSKVERRKINWRNKSFGGPIKTTKPSGQVHETQYTHPLWKAKSLEILNG